MYVLFCIMEQLFGFAHNIYEYYFFAKNLVRAFGCDNGVMMFLCVFFPNIVCSYVSIFFTYLFFYYTFY